MRSNMHSGNRTALPIVENLVRNRAGFREWLKARTEPMECRNGCDCPLATYLNEKTSRPPDDRISFNPEAKNAIPGQTWHHVFGLLVDAEPTDTITPERCLELLDSIPEDKA